jgi:hypothetical protein
MTIVPDTKDWTWVLQRPCPECGLDARSCARDAVAGMIRSNASAWHDALAQPAGARHRPAPGKWSALEYGCHVRDVLRLYDQRLGLMLTQEGPRYPNWDQDATAVADRYDEQDPATVAAELAQAAETIAARFDALSPGNGSAPAAAATAPISRLNRLRATSSTTRSITSTTSPAFSTLTGPDQPPDGYAHAVADGHGSRCGDQPSPRPPSTTMRWPVMKPAPGEARKLTAWAMSSGVPIRPAGTDAR